jgi:hypothetical protein
VVLVAVVIAIARCRTAEKHVTIDEEEEGPELLADSHPANPAQFQTSLEHIFDNPVYDDPTQPLNNSEQGFSDTDEALLVA